MGKFGPGDLSASKLRPALVVARAGVTDWVLCQITSNRYGDPLSVAITKSSFETGGLERESFVRPGKLFTANAGVVIRSIGQLSSEAHGSVVEAIVTAAARRGPISGPSIIAPDKARRCGRFAASR